jgi:hypothetical protein
VGWSRRALIEWPERGARLTMTAEPPLDYLVIFTPRGRRFFCAEPVSHVTDAFNLAAAGHPDTGFRVLAPGETLASTIALTPLVQEAQRTTLRRPRGERPDRVAQDRRVGEDRGNAQPTHGGGMKQPGRSDQEIA